MSRKLQTEPSGKGLTKQGMTTHVTVSSSSQTLVIMNKKPTCGLFQRVLSHNLCAIKLILCNTKSRLVDLSTIDMTDRKNNYFYHQNVLFEAQMHPFLGNYIRISDLPCSCTNAT